MGSVNTGQLRPLLPTRQEPLNAQINPQSTATPLSGRQVTLRKRALTTAACLRCRQGKAKCDGRRPVCGRCFRKNLDCAYNRAPNETPAFALKREHEALKNQYKHVKTNGEAMVQIFELLRTRPASDTSLVLSLLQESVDAEDIVRQITEGDLLLQMHLRPETNFRFEFPWRATMPTYIQNSRNPYLQAPLHAAASIAKGELQVTRCDGSMSSQYLMPLSAAKIVDDRLDSVKPSLYTNVSKNDRVMRTLLREFFLFGYDWACVFQLNDFLDDMLAHKYDFCSPLLVNIVLAYSTHCSLAFPRRAQFWNPNTLGYRFMAEARRLWDIDFLAESPTLPSFQGGILMYLLYRFYGMDKVASEFQQELFRCIDMLDLAARSVPGESHRYRRSRGISVWFWFWMQSMISYHYKEMPPMSTIPAVALPNPGLEPEFYGELMLKYPLGQVLQPMHIGWSLHACVRHGILMHRYSTNRFASRGQPNIEDIQDLAYGLRSWYQTLPEVLLPQNIVLPLHFKAHIHWLQSAIEVQDLLATVGLPPMDMFSSSHVTTSPAAEVKATLQAAYETLARIQYLRHGFEHCNSLSIQNLNILAFSALKSLRAARQTDSQVSPTVIDDARSTLILAAKGLHDQSKNWHLCRTILQIVVDSMAKEDLELLERFARVKIDDGEAPVARGEHITAEYPLDIASPHEEDVEARKLGNVLKQKNASRVAEFSRESSTPSTRDSARG